MDELNIFAKKDGHQGRIRTVNAFSDEQWWIRVEFGPEKGAKAALERGKLTQTFNIQVDNNTTIIEIEKKKLTGI